MIEENGYADKVTEGHNGAIMRFFAHMQMCKTHDVRVCTQSTVFFFTKLVAPIFLILDKMFTDI